MDAAMMPQEWMLKRLGTQPPVANGHFTHWPHPKQRPLPPPPPDAPPSDRQTYVTPL
jgi:hypothetical protein